MNDTLFSKDPQHPVWRIVETDNYGRDYPNESFHGPCLNKAEAERTAELFNSSRGRDDSRWFTVKHMSYTLQPGFEP